jgi:hypothetical protein
MSSFADAVRVTARYLVVVLRDGRTVSVPLNWYPRLVYGTVAQRRSWRLIGRGAGIHWPQLDEDVRVEDLLAGRRSGESNRSLQRWLASRQRRVGASACRTINGPKRNTRAERSRVTRVRH